MIFLLGIIIPFLSYTFQIYPRFINRYFGVDVWMRMIEADIIRKNHHKIPKNKISNGFILEGYFYYPPGLAWLLSFIPKKILLEIQGFISPIFDILQNFLIYMITLNLTGRWEIALTAQLIYATIPVTVMENSYLTPRALGYLFFTIAFYPLLLYSITPNPIFLIISVTFTILAFFTHKFATQSLLFLTIFFSLVEKNPFYISIFIISMVTAMIISKGFYLKILGEHLGVIYYWTKNYKNHYAYQIKGFKIKKKVDFVGLLYFLLSKFSPIALLGTNVWIIYPFAILIAKSINLDLLLFSNPLFFKMALWVLFFYVLSILVLSVDFLRSIGEGQRYMEMATVPSSILSSIVLFTLVKTPLKTPAIAVFILILITNISLTIFLQQKAVIRDKSRSMTKSIQEAFKFINRLKYKTRILCIPQQIASMVIFNTKAKVLVDFQATTGNQIQDVYPVLTKPLKDIAKKYNLNLLILNKNYSSIKKLKLTKKSILFETEDIQLLKI